MKDALRFFIYTADDTLDQPIRLTHLELEKIDPRIRSGLQSLLDTGDLQPLRPPQGWGEQAVTTIVSCPPVTVRR